MNNFPRTALAYLCAAVVLWGAGSLAPQSGAASADEGAGGGQKLVAKLKALRPGIPIENVSTTPLPGIYALELKGGTMFYGTEDGQYLFAGDLYQLGDKDLINLADAGRAEKRKELISKVSTDQMIIFPATVPRKAVISVFTDVDCGYCRKLHQEVPELNAMGIEVRYLAYPRAGLSSPSYDKAVSAWCSADPNAAITTLKAGGTIPAATCDNPVASEFELGQEMGVTGTPSILLEDGTMLPGFLSAPDLAAAVGI